MQKSNIIKKNFEFQEIINLRVQTVSRDLIIYYRPNNKHLRVGISISKKFGNAVVRNRQRRQVRVIMDQINKFDMEYDVILILRKSFLPLSFQTKKDIINKQLTRMDNGK